MKPKKKNKEFKDFIENYLASSTGELNIDSQDSDDIITKINRNLIFQEKTEPEIEKQIEENTIIEIDFERYKIKIELTQDYKFVRILEIRVKKDFRSYLEKMEIGDHKDLHEFFIK
jgi:hypothetical protein